MVARHGPASCRPHSRLRPCAASKHLSEKSCCSTNAECALEATHLPRFDTEKEPAHQNAGDITTGDKESDLCTQPPRAQSRMVYAASSAGQESNERLRSSCYCRPGAKSQGLGFQSQRQKQALLAWPAPGRFDSQRFGAGEGSPLPGVNQEAVSDRCGAALVAQAADRPIRCHLLRTE